MGFLRRLIYKIKYRDHNKDGSWYNNHHEKKKSKWNEIVEGAAFSSNNQIEHNVVMQVAKK